MSSEPIPILGLWNLGEGTFHRKLTAREGREIIKASYRKGIHNFSSAYSYGDADSILASSMKELGKDDWRIYTKVMAVPTLRRKAETMLSRLKRDFLDVLMIHWPSEEDSIYRALQTLEELKAEGKTQAIGVSNFPLQYLRKVSADFDITYHERPLSLIWSRDWQEEKALGLRTLAYAPLGMGILSGRYHNREALPDERKNLEVAKSESVWKLAGEIMGAGEAISWVYDEKPYGVISGFSSVSDLSILDSISPLSEGRRKMLDESAEAIRKELSHDNIFSHSWRNA